MVNINGMKSKINGKESCEDVWCCNRVLKSVARLFEVRLESVAQFEVDGKEFIGRKAVHKGRKKD
jgi:hypothetical protein